ncbi:transcriptional regulator [Scytonema hofmannii PCC 7110]|uniref:Transcriptional regulator n=1 Tax=Scytonema hofmannii PCC 7110 TaxID=128403 RepID=A0A139XAT3_9CYAN|nr:PAS domain S-box protein [Scytonema hofmannii]KYC41732.1 transcriptional regulator [Scytonema hofmannii PCC 7110]
MDINKVEIDKFVHRAQRMHGRLADLYQNVNIEPLIPDVLPQTFVELGNASEIVQLATEELYQQNEELILTRNLVELERQRYRDLFEFAPDAYFVTDTKGIIQEANCAAVKLLNALQQYLVGKPISNYVALEDRQSFRSFLTQLSKCNKVAESVLRWQKRNGELFDGACTVGVVYNCAGIPIALRWLVRDITERNLSQLTLINNECDLSQNRPQHQYSKGETISLTCQEIWYVCQGLVKLTTLCPTGSEVLIGLLTEGMVFGSSMTKLHIYTATAMSDVTLINIKLAEIEANPTLNHIVSPKINQRLQQTEFLLAISGQRRVQDRFYYLLQFLKQELGTPVAHGTRLNFRFTHEDLASACSTTRVTITRMISKLKREGQISFDFNNHIIVKNI